MSAGLAQAGFAAGLLLCCGSSLACGESLGGATREIADAQYLLVFRTSPDPVVVGRHFTLDFALCPRPPAGLPEDVRVNAHMPQHRHGMNYLPSVTALGSGIYHAQGLMFHMPGRWELYFDLQGSSGPVRLAQSLQVD
jgi:hypothetical protein